MISIRDVKIEVKLTQPFLPDNPSGIINFIGNKQIDISSNESYNEMSFNLYLTVEALKMILDEKGKDYNIYIMNPINYVIKALFNVENWEKKNFMRTETRKYKNIDLLFELFRIKRNFKKIYIIWEIPYIDLSNS